VALQAYAIGSGIAQGGAGLALAKGLADYPEVPSDDLGFAIFLSAILTFVPAMVFLSLLAKNVTRRAI
jgi:F0F1-type ATP synthase membrane subunit c/vacuolar-type H+-ATPase subunit K